MANKTVMKTATENKAVDMGCAQVNIDDIIHGLQYLKEYAQTKVDESLSDESFKVRLQEAVHDLTKATSERILRRNSTKRDIATQLLEQIFNSQYHLEIITNMVAAKLAQNSGPTDLQG